MKLIAPGVGRLSGSLFRSDVEAQVQGCNKVGRQVGLLLGAQASRLPDLRHPVVWE